MSHSLILGMTESGKTTLAKRLAQRYRKVHGICVIVLDPLNDPAWEADFQTTDEDEFLKVFWESRRCAVFIDEAGEAVGRYNVVMQKTATRGRHWGHSVHYLSQRATQINVTVRDQCSHLFLLTSSAKDGALHAQEWNEPQLATCNNLRKGEYFHATRFGTTTKGALFGNHSNTGNGRRELPEEQTDASSTQESEDEGNLSKRSRAKAGNSSTGASEGGNEARDDDSSAGEQTA